MCPAFRTLFRDGPGRGRTVFTLCPQSPGYPGAVLAVAQFHAPLPLTNTIQRYDWGSVDAVPHLLGLEPDGEPQAELWLGAHTSAPSVSLIEGEDVALDRLVREATGWRSSSARASPTC